MTKKDRGKNLAVPTATGLSKAEEQELARLQAIEARMAAKPAPKEREAAAIARAQEIVAEMMEADMFGPPMDLTAEGDVMRMECSHSDERGNTARLMALLGTVDHNWMNQLLLTLSWARGSGSGEIQQSSLRAGLGFMAGMKPKNPAEAMLAAQMFAVHCATMNSARRFANAENVMQSEDAGRSLAKFGNLAVKQVEAFGKLKSGGKQQVEVRYIYVDARNSQNIIGTGEPGEQIEIGRQPHAIEAAIHHGATLRSPDPSRAPLPVASGGGPNAMPDARGGQSGGA